MLLAVMILAGVLLGRLYGIAADGIEGSYTLYALMIEAPLFLLCAYAKWSA